MNTLSEDADMENLSVDSTCVKVHESANEGEKRHIKRLAILNTKLHAVVDVLRTPVAFLLSTGNDHDSVHAIELLEKSSSKGAAYWQIALMAHSRFGHTSQSMAPAM